MRGPAYVQIKCDSPGCVNGEEDTGLLFELPEILPGLWSASDLDRILYEDGWIRVGEHYYCDDCSVPENERHLIRTESLNP